MNNLKKTLIAFVALLLFSGIASAEPFLSAFYDQQSSEITECSGDCPVQFRGDDTDTGIGIGAGGYYTGFGFVDVGADLRLVNDPSINLLVRKRVGPVSLILGAGRTSQDIETRVAGLGVNSSDVKGYIYSATLEYHVTDNHGLFVRYAASEADHDLVAPNAAATARVTVENEHLAAGYSYHF